MNRYLKQRAGTGILYLLVVLLMAFTLIPVLWMVISALKPEADIWETVPRWIPKRVTAENFVWAFGPYSSNIVPLLINSLITSAVTALITALLHPRAVISWASSNFPEKSSLPCSLFFHSCFKAPF